MATTELNGNKSMTEETVIVSVDDLADKTKPHIANLLSISFEYLLAGVAETYHLANKYSSIEAFSERNRLTKFALLSYPFFVATSNGHAESLYALFGDFYSYSFVPISKSVENLIGNLDKKDIRRLYFFRITERKIEVIRHKLLENSFSEVKTQLQNELLSEFSSSQNILCTPFKNIYIKHDEIDEVSPLYKVIDNGLKICTKRLGDSFFDGSLSNIMTLSKTYDALNNDDIFALLDKVEFSEIQAQRNRYRNRNEIKITQK